MGDPRQRDLRETGPMVVTQGNGTSGQWKRLPQQHFGSAIFTSSDLARWRPVSSAERQAARLSSDALRVRYVF